METYILTSEAFEGQVIINNDNGNLTANFLESNISLGQQKFVLDMMSRGIDVMLANINKPGNNAKMVAMVIDFDMFWNRYDDKLSSSRKRTKAKWDKMSESERAKAYHYIGKYFCSIPGGTRKKYAETYLNAELWNN